MTATTQLRHRTGAYRPCSEDMIVSADEAAARAGASSTLEFTAALLPHGGLRLQKGRVHADLRVVLGEPVEFEVPDVEVIGTGVLR